MDMFLLTLINYITCTFEWTEVYNQNQAQTQLLCGTLVSTCINKVSLFAHLKKRAPPSYLDVAILFSVIIYIYIKQWTKKKNNEYFQF